MEILPVQHRTRKQWAEHITRHYTAAVRAILDVGRCLLEAKDQLDHGEFGHMIAEDLPFSWRTANRLMAIAQHPVLANWTHVSNLPASWGTLYELSKLPPPVLEDALKAGRITPEMPRKAVASLLLSHPPPVRSHRTVMVADLTQLVQAGKRFRTIYVVPPWEGSGASRRNGETEARTVSFAELRQLPVNALADDQAHLHLWTTDAFIFDCQSLMASWGFRYQNSMLIWIKSQTGRGKWWGNTHEMLLLGTRGTCPFRSQHQTGWIATEEKEGGRKPEEVRQTIEQVSPPPYLELFGHRPVDGWTVWGDGVDCQ